MFCFFNSFIITGHLIQLRLTLLYLDLPSNLKMFNRHIIIFFLFGVNSRACKVWFGVNISLLCWLRRFFMFVILVISRNQWDFFHYYIKKKPNKLSPHQKKKRFHYHSSLEFFILAISWNHRDLFYHSVKKNNLATIKNVPSFSLSSRILYSRYFLKPHIYFLSFGLKINLTLIKKSFYYHSAFESFFSSYFFKPLIFLPPFYNKST